MMLKNVSLVEDFKKVQLQKEPPDYFRHLRIFEALYREATQLGVLPLKDPLEGIDVDIRLAMVLNVRTAAPKDQRGVG